MTNLIERLEAAKGTSLPKCPSCGSNDIGFPGVCTFHYRAGKWRVIRHSVAMNENADCFHCGQCGEILDGQFQPPFNFSVQIDDPYSPALRTREADRG